ncbi:MAG: sodium-dependent transporter [Acidobacteriota bacterium]
MHTTVETQRGTWTSRLGFILAAAGSAIGLGNLWKFPYVTWSGGGGAFVVVYLTAVAVVGLPIMIAEILLGRRTQKSSVGALREALGPAWGWLGLFGVLTGSVILSYYTVIAGWTLRYFVICLQWSLGGFVASESSTQAFAEFTANGWLQALLVTLFMVGTMTAVYRGISGGIEKVARYLMPVLFAILLVLLLNALRMPGAGEALGFLFRPDFSQLPARGALEALGQAFFSLSLGMGAMITYGSYLGKKESIVRSAAIVVVLDTLIAMTAAVILFSVIFSVPGMQNEISGSTIGMLFIALPELIYTAVPLGRLMAPLFYLFVAFAALTSTVSLLEVGVSYLIDQRGTTRKQAVFGWGLVIWIVAIGCSLSLGAADFLSRFSWVYRGTEHAKVGLFAHLDYLASNWLLSIGGFCITLGVGWVLSRRVAEEELLDDTTPGWFHFGAWRFFMRYVAPIAVAVIIAAVLSGMDFS